MTMFEFVIGFLIAAGTYDIIKCSLYKLKLYFAAKKLRYENYSQSSIDEVISKSAQKHRKKRPTQ